MINFEVRLQRTPCNDDDDDDLPVVYTLPHALPTRIYTIYLHGRALEVEATSELAWRAWRRRRDGALHQPGLPPGPKASHRGPLMGGDSRRPSHL